MYVSVCVCMYVRKPSDIVCDTFWPTNKQTTNKHIHTHTHTHIALGQKRDSASITHYTHIHITKTTSKHTHTHTHTHTHRAVGQKRDSSSITHYAHTHITETTNKHTHTYTRAQLWGKNATARQSLTTHTHT